MKACFASSGSRGWVRIVPLAILGAWAAVRVSAASLTLLWSDDFNQTPGSAPDAVRWTYDLGAGGWGNGELQTYTASPANSFIALDAAALDGRALVIQAIKGGDGTYTSARLKTQGLFQTTYGRIEARMRIPEGNGLWPAFWMLGSNITAAGWPACGEIDVMEILGRTPGKLYGTLHGPGYSGANGIGNTFTLAGATSFGAAYHVFAVDWSPNRIAWSVDGHVYHVATPADLPGGSAWVFNHSPFFLILDLAVGGLFPGAPDASTPLPASCWVDHVRVYGMPPSAPTDGVVLPGFDGRVTVAWTAPADLNGYELTGYRLESWTTAGSTQSGTYRLLGRGTAYKDAAGSDGSTTYYRVSAITSGGESDYSRIFTLGGGTLVAPDPLPFSGAVGQLTLAPALEPAPSPPPAQPLAVAFVATPAPTPSSPGSGGGGGSIDPWFFAALALLALGRRSFRRQS